MFCDQLEDGLYPMIGILFDGHIGILPGCDSWSFMPFYGAINSCDLEEAQSVKVMNTDTLD